MKKYTSYITAFLYTVLIGAGMYTSFYINGVHYEKPEMINTLWIFEIVMVLLLIWVVIKFYSWKEVGFTKIDKKQALWLIPTFGLLAFAAFPLIDFISQNTDKITPEQWKLFGLVAFTTALVGFGEELMYRGIMLWEFMKKNKLISWVLISSVIFGFLHAVNVFWGQSVNATISQVVVTSVVWLFFALLRIKIKNIIPLMIFHWLYDFILIGSGVFGLDTPDTAVYLFVFEIWFILIFLPMLIWGNKKKTKKITL